MRQLLFLTLLVLNIVKVSAHTEGSKFSGAIIDPLRVHHAHIEDEQRVNFSRIENADGSLTFLHSIELAVAWGKGSRFGSEIVIPYSNTGLDKEDQGIGDIELQLIKYAFINKPDTIVTGVFALGLPTGNSAKGLGTDNTVLGALLFIDKAYGNWYWGVNLELETVVDGEKETEFEFATSISYSFIKGTKDFAPTKPNQ